MKRRYLYNTVNNRTPLSQKGFTIVELLIATLVFSLILIVIVSGVISFTNSYYRGINSSSTQTIAYTVSDSLVQAIQYSTADPVMYTATTTPASTPNTICLGNKEYSYQIGVEPNEGSALTGPIGMFQFLIGAGSGGSGGCVLNPSVSNVADNPPAPAASPWLRGHELIGTHMRLANLSIKPIGASGAWSVNITVVYGDFDLFCDSTVAPNSSFGCNKGAPPITTAAQLAAVGHIQCKQQTGSQFCSVATIKAVAQRRLI